MKKQFLIITSKSSNSIDWHERNTALLEFIDALGEKLDDLEIHYITYDDLICVVIGNQVSIIDNTRNIDLKNVHLVHFKNWLFDSEQAATIAFYLNQHNVQYFNSEVDAGLAWGKIAQMIRLAFNGINVPDTYFAKNLQMKQAINTKSLPKSFTFPAILKSDDGAKGNDNHLVNSADEAIKILEQSPDKHYVLQTFLPNDGDLRFLFFGFENVPLVFHRKAVEGNHLNNTSQGGQGSFIATSNLPDGYIGLARRAAIALKREISGVDILVDKTSGTAYILEVNSTPAIATGYGVDRKNKLFADFINGQLEFQEEE